jgi:hypothetical protein
MARRRRKTTKRDGIIHSYRKVIQHGGSLAITIPEEWAKEHGIKKGDELALTANSILSAVKTKEVTKGGTPNGT